MNAQKRSAQAQKKGHKQKNTWMSQEVSKTLGSVDYNPNIPHL